MSKEEIILKAFGVSKKSEMLTEHFIGLQAISFIEKAMTEYAHLALEEAAEVAETDVDYSGEHIRHIVDKQSILKLKEKY